MQPVLAHLRYLLNCTVSIMKIRYVMGLHENFRWRRLNVLSISAFQHFSISPFLQFSILALQHFSNLAIQHFSVFAWTIQANVHLKTLNFQKRDNWRTTTTWTIVMLTTRDAVGFARHLEKDMLLKLEGFTHSLEGFTHILEAFTHN